jgi:hypothetical protein
VTAPPGVMPTLTSGRSTRSEARSQTQKRFTAAFNLALAWNIGWSPMRVSKLVRRYEFQVESKGFTLFDFLCNAAQLTVERREAERRAALGDPDNMILFADPVGELAVRNVLRQRGY